MFLHKDKKKRNKNYNIGLQGKENNPKTKTMSIHLHVLCSDHFLVSAKQTKQTQNKGNALWQGQNRHK